jgi:hypothetical protein
MWVSLGKFLAGNHLPGSEGAGRQNRAEEGKVFCGLLVQTVRIRIVPVDAAAQVNRQPLLAFGLNLDVAFTNEI